ncbi:hypothetical protein SAMN05216348_10918 [Olsenella sp. KH3B4]|nr:hypothetical protein SAMN05216348_10918 [Olsenella sp. KH3B4]
MCPTTQPQWRCPWDESWSCTTAGQTATRAPAVRTLLNSRKWNGKVVVPFSTCAGWAGSTLDDIAGLAEGARIAEPLTVTFASDGGARMVTDPRKVSDWAGRVAALV